MINDQYLHFQRLRHRPNAEVCEVVRHFVRLLFKMAPSAICLKDQTLLKHLAIANWLLIFCVLMLFNDEVSSPTFEVASHL